MSTSRSTRLSSAAGPGRAAGADRLGAELTERLREANRNLLARPRISIRWRLVASLALCLCLCGAFAFTALSMLGKVRAKLALLDATERLSEDILRARAQGGDGLPEGPAIRHMLEHAATTERLLLEAGEEVRTEDPWTLDALARHLVVMTELLAGRSAEVEAVEVERTPTPEAAALGQEETEVLSLLDRIVERERASTMRILRLAEKGPLVLLGFLVALFGAITYSFARALVDPIRRFQTYTTRIAAGDFSLIRPARSYRDEFTDLALAVNLMLAELQAHQERIVKAGKMAAVGTLTSGIAHELNNPLNNIAITTEALIDEMATLSEEDRWNLLQDIYFETERAGEIVRSLLDFTRQEKPETAALDLADVIQSTVRLAQNEMALNNVTFVSDLPAELPRIRGAVNQLRQVFLNIFINAIQSMPSGGTLTVALAPREAGMVCVEIRDQGGGIAPEIQPHIFDPFFTTKEPGQGAGLGLSVSLGIIRKFGGDIRVESEPGRGSVFHVCLPAAEEP
jgi:two-component system NtrC family sensor kinase